MYRVPPSARRRASFKVTSYFDYQSNKLLVDFLLGAHKVKVTASDDLDSSRTPTRNTATAAAFKAEYNHQFYSQTNTTLLQ
jgi:hypothetical protein